MELSDEVVAVVSTTLGVTVDAEASMENTSDWNSLNYVNVVCALEERFGVLFSRDELPLLGSVSSICSLLRAKNSSGTPENEGGSRWTCAAT